MSDVVNKYFLVATVRDERETIPAESRSDDDGYFRGVASLLHEVDQPPLLTLRASYLHDDPLQALREVLTKAATAIDELHEAMSSAARDGTSS
jgi:hypothetical protein